MESHTVIQNRASKIAPFLSKIAPVYGIVLVCKNNELCTKITEIYMYVFITKVVRTLCG